MCHVDGQKNPHEPIFPYNTVEIFQLLKSIALFLLVQITSNLIQGQTVIIEIWSKLGQIDHNLHNHAFDDVICKPPIEIIDF